MSVQAVPGVYSGRTVAPRRVLWQAGRDRVVQVPVKVDGTNSYDGGNTSYEKCIRGGALMAYNSSTAKWTPVKRSKANALGSSSTALVVDNSTHFRVGDSIIVGSNAANVATAINYTTHTITLTSAITWHDNDPVTVSGYETARGVLLDDEVKLYDDWAPTTYVDRTAQVLVAGTVDQDKVLGDLAGILEDPDSFFFLRDVIFDDYQLGVDTMPVPFGLFGFQKYRYVTTDYTVVAADNGTLFIATGAATFTLPTKAAGLAFGFLQISDNNMIVASAGSADDIVTDGDLGADTITYSTSSHKIGSALAVMVAPNLLKWLTFSLNETTQTIA